ncbi:hypothetical protein OCH239_16695 [Roseivivax halodurans JCM 10272]|uniref:Uncharacterized protein n=2 Tax=Roseivivax halodurans TaxID=93683 RepID=X7EHS8_9RHOB|nr:hypothetical protein OCH239_16695 [Roseivivax halodurans JCM 10272]
MKAHRTRIAGNVPAPQATKADATTDAAREIIETETRARSERTAKLREQRLARLNAGMADPKGT